jgi:hypothetical protein
MGVKATNKRTTEATEVTEITEKAAICINFTTRPHTLAGDSI